MRIRSAFGELLIFLLVVASSTSCRSAGSIQPRSALDAVDQVLRPQVTPAFQSDVLVLGTTHLSGSGDRLRPEHLEPLLAVLQRFAPTRIAVESLTADEIALLAEREVHDAAAAEVINMFARGTVTSGRRMQEAVGLDRVAAERRARTILEKADSARTPDERLEAVRYLLAAFEPVSAALQWSYLSDDVRQRSAALPPDVLELLERRLHSANEIYTLAVPLARRLGLEWIHAIDSQYEGVRTLSASPDALRELFTDPGRGELRDHAAGKYADSVKEAAFAAGDLLPLYRHANSAAYQAGDVSQWNWLFQLRNSSGLDRFRYAMWELRNLRQAMNVVDVAASGRPERLLVIVGSSHKAHLDKLLATQLSVRLVQLEELLQPFDDAPQ
jgi:hypothetical protein